jgi:hypothetical protein
MMVVFLSGDIPKEDLTHIEMQIDVRARLSWLFDFSIFSSIYDFNNDVNYKNSE